MRYVGLICIVIFVLIFLTGFKLSYIGPLLPNNLKIFLKENILIFSKLNNQNKEINNLEEKLENISIINESIYRKRNIDILFNRIQENTYKIKNKNLKLTKYKTSSLITGKWEVSGGSFYIDEYDNNIFIASATGIIAWGRIENLNNKKSFSLRSIKSNIEKLILDKDFFYHSPFGVKDILILENKIYLSYTNQVSKGCYNTSILVAEINYEKLDFSKFFVPDECIKINLEYGTFSAHQSGGRIVKLDNKNIILTIGSYGFEEYAQNFNNTFFGKTILINISDKKVKILSGGHRNAQGLFYDEKKNRLFMTEHGPQGGDEINLNNLNTSGIKNYGWPIASYGEHYFFEKRDDNHPYYKKAPLYKSHKKYGFMEPIKYFTPSIGISEILLLYPTEFDENYNVIIGSLGNNILEGDKSLHFFKLDEKNNLVNHNILKINERIRDLKKIKKNKKIITLLSLESSSSIGLLEMNNEYLQ